MAYLCKVFSHPFQCTCYVILKPHICSNIVRRELTFNTSKWLPHICKTKFIKFNHIRNSTHWASFSSNYNSQWHTSTKNLELEEKNEDFEDHNKVFMSNEIISDSIVDGSLTKKLLSGKTLNGASSLKMIKIINWEFGKIKSRELKLEKINLLSNQENFQKICSTLERSLHTFTPEDQLFLLNFGVLFNIPFSSSIMRKVIHLIMCNINHYTILKVTSLYVNLQKIESENCLDIEELKMVCHKFLTERFQNEIHEELPLINVAYFVGHAMLPNTLRCQFMEILQKDKKFLTLPLRAYPWILKGLDKLKLNQSTVLEIWENLLEGLKHNKNYPSDLLQKVTKFYTSQVLKEKLEYQQNICNFLGSKIVESKSELKNAVYTMLDFCKIYHFHYDLFNYIVTESKKFENSPESDEVFPNIVKVFFYTGVKLLDKESQKFFKDKAESFDFAIFFEKEIKSENYVNSLHTALGLASLNFCKSDFFERVFRIISTNFQKNLSFLKFNYWNVLLFHQWATTLSLPSGRYSMSEIVDLCVTESSKFRNFVWLSIVEKIFGGSCYVLKNCSCDLNHNLDYVVLLDSENKPIDLSVYKSDSSQTPVDLNTIQKPSNSKIVVIQEVPSLAEPQFKNVDLDTANVELYCQTLSCLGYHVVPIKGMRSDICFSSEDPFILKKLIEEKVGKICQN